MPEQKFRYNIGWEGELIKGAYLYGLNLILVSISALLQVTFFVLPHATLGYKTFKRERLIANDFLQIRKVRGGSETPVGKIIHFSWMFYEGNTR